MEALLDLTFLRLQVEREWFVGAIRLGPDTVCKSADLVGHHKILKELRKPAKPTDHVGSFKFEFDKQFEVEIQNRQT